jgi:hypothetical protein
MDEGGEKRVRGTQHIASTAPCGAEGIAKHNQRVGPRPVGWQPRVPDRAEVAPYRRRALIGPATFGIFDAFADDTGRKAHLAGPIAAALMAKASELLAEPPQIEQVDVLGAKIPH